MDESAKESTRWHDLAAVLLARGYSKVETAKRAGIGLRTLYTHLDNPAFRKKINDLRNEVKEELVGQLHAMSAKVVKTLNNLLESQDERTQLGAVKTWLQTFVDLSNKPLIQDTNMTTNTDANITNEDMTTLVESALYKKALQGDVKAIIMWLSSRCPERWKVNLPDEDYEKDWRQQISKMIQEQEQNGPQINLN